MIMGGISVVAAILIAITLVDVFSGIDNGIESESESGTSNESYNKVENGQAGSSNGGENGTDTGDNQSGNNKDDDSEHKKNEAIINPDGMTLMTRINTPSGYMRTEVTDESLGEFVRNYQVKEDGAKVLIYDGTEKENQDAHVAVFTLPLEARDLQHCADSVMRMYAEYYLSTKQYEKIGFHLTDGFYADYAKWREGNRIVFSDSGSYWSKKKDYNDSYEIFQEYMRIVFAYAGSYSMKSECEAIEPSEIQIGDVFIYGGSPGHVAMIVDVCEDADGNKAFLLAQGFMPAQEFHILKNPNHEDDPWYYIDEIKYPFVTPEYTFKEGSLMRPEY